MTTGEMMLRFGKGLGANAVAMGALTALGFALPKKASEGLNVVMDAAAVAALVSGVDPAFAVVQGTMELVKEMTTQSHRLKYNLESDRDHGNNFGYVRDGAHWYPAYVKQHEKWEGGVGERGNDIDLIYGTHMTLTVLPNNTIEPHFQQQLGVRHVTGSDKDLLKTFKHITAEDPLRDWYLLQPDQLDMVRRAGQIIVLPKAGFVVHKDDWDLYKVPPSRSDGEPYLPTWWKANLDLRRSLDYIHHWQIGSKGGKDLTGQQHDTGIDPSLGFDAHGAFVSRLDKDFKQAWPGNEDYKMSEHWHGAKERETNKFVLHKLLKDQIVQLQKAQFMAAKEQGYAPETFETYDPKEQVAVPSVGGIIALKKKGSFTRPSSQPWRNYVDFEKDLGTADSSAVLNEHLRKIMGYTDRTAKQKGYLGQKAIVRYLMQSITDRGGADALAQYLTKGHDVEHGFKNRTGDNEYDPEGFFGTDRMQKYMAPWANRTEVALPPGVIDGLNKDHRALIDHLGSLSRAGVAKDPTSWAHRTGPLPKAPEPPPEWHVNIDKRSGTLGPNVEEALQSMSDAPKLKPPSALKVEHTGKGKSLHVRFAETLEERFPYRNIKGVDRDIHLIHDEFERNGAKNLSSSDLRKLRKYEDHQLYLERHASGMSKGYWDAYLKAHGGKTPDEVKRVGRYSPNVHNPKDSFYTEHLDKYYWDVTQSPRRWIDKNEKHRRDLQHARVAKKKQEHVKYVGKNEKARAAIAAQNAAKVALKLAKMKEAQAFRPLTEAEKRDKLNLEAKQWNEIDSAMKAEAKRLAQIAKRGAETTIVKKAQAVTKKGGPLKDLKAERRKAWLAAGHAKARTAQTKMGLGLPVTVVPVVSVPRAPIVPHGFQHHKDPSDVQFAQTHSDFVAVPRLSWNENAVAKFEGRPITSHESVQQPSHEEPVPQTHIKVI